MTQSQRGAKKHPSGRCPGRGALPPMPRSSCAGARQPETVGAAVLEKAACGVDYVKFGLFPDGDARRCLDALRLQANAA
jgi:hypothetical protein